MMITSLIKNKVTHKVTRNEEEYIIEPLITLKYSIATGKTFSDKEWQDILLDNAYYYYDRIGLKRLKTLQTELELYNYLVKKEAPKNIAKQLVSKYVESNYLNDYEYSKIYINSNKQKKGPKVLIEKLKTKGVNLEIINKALKEIDEASIVDNIVSNFISKNKSKTSFELNNKIKRSLITKGYSYDIINNAISKNSHKYNINEKELLDKAYEMAVIRMIPNTDKDKYKQKLFNRFYRKGFKSEDIKAMEIKYF